MKNMEKVEEIEIKRDLNKMVLELGKKLSTMEEVKDVSMTLTLKNNLVIGFTKYSEESEDYDDGDNLTTK